MIKLEVLPTEEDIYYDIALDMFDEIRKNNGNGKNTVFICPVGPAGQYEKFARMVNRYGLRLKSVYIFNMDEYLDDDRRYIPKDHPLSFRAVMDRELYGRIAPELNIPEQNRIFPEPGNEKFIWQKLQELGGVDICFGGIGINGHIAFNEPPEENENITDQEFLNLGTRILPVSRETKTINSVSAARGDIKSMPNWCITIGMKEIFNSRKIRVSAYRDWQTGILRRILFDPVTAMAPASFLQMHPDARLAVTGHVAGSLDVKLK